MSVTSPQSSMKTPPGTPLCRAPCLGDRFLRGCLCPGSLHLLSAPPCRPSRLRLGGRGRTDPTFACSCVRFLPHPSPRSSQGEAPLAVPERPCTRHLELELPGVRGGGEAGEPVGLGPGPTERGSAQPLPAQGRAPACLAHCTPTPGHVGVPCVPSGHSPGSGWVEPIDLSPGRAP